MASSFRNPTAAELQILMSNGIDADGVSVILHSDSSMVVRNHRTGDDIMICAGEKSSRLNIFGKSQTPGNKKEKT